MPRVIWLLNRRDQEGAATVTRVLDSQCGAFVAELGVPCVKPASPKFFHSLTQIRPGYYAAKLRINAIHVSDFGQYTCTVRHKTWQTISYRKQFRKNVPLYLS